MDGLTLGWCRRLMREEDGGVLGVLGGYVGFQCAVGMNGRVWVDAGEVGKTVVVARCIREGEGLEGDEIRRFVREILAKAG